MENGWISSKREANKKKMTKMVFFFLKIYKKFDPNSNVLNTNIEDHNLYKPKTKENRILYEQIL